MLLAESLGRRELVFDYLRQYDLRPVACDDYAEFMASDQPFMLSVAPLYNGFILPGEGLAFITENELYAKHMHGRHRQSERDSRKSLSVDAMLRDLSEIKAGDPVVHEQHGIGRYLGLVSMDLGEGAAEFMSLEYDGG